MWIGCGSEFRGCEACGFGAEMVIQEHCGYGLDADALRG